MRDSCGRRARPAQWWRGLAPRAPQHLRALLRWPCSLVLVVGALLARFLSVENAERGDDLALVQAEARGDVAGMLDQLSGCRAQPVVRGGGEGRRERPALRRAGAVKILQLESPTAYSLSGATGKTRLAWTVIGTLPVVQCVDVRRTGNFLSGIHVQLIGISAPIAGEGTMHEARRRSKEEEEEATAAEQ